MIMELIRQHISIEKYGGIMIWELTQDCKGDKSLLKVINDSFNMNSSVEGDINGDKELNSADLVTLSLFLLGYKNTNIVNWKDGDLCEDNTLNLYDLIAMRKLIIS